MIGTTVTLYEERIVGTDAIGAPVYQETPVDVENVLVGEPTTEDIVSSQELHGKKVSFVLGIPKGDSHDWKDKKVEWTDAYGRRVCRTFGFPITGIEENIPGPWHMKVRCEAVG